MPCVVLDQAAVSAQSDLAGATAPRRGNSTALWSLPAELAAVSTHEFLGHLHEIVSSEMRWLNDRRLDTSTSGTLSTGESTDQLADDLHSICVMLCCSCVSGRGSDFIMRITLLTMEVLMMYQARYVQNFLDSRPTP